jgi:hypothetical protein
MIADDLQAWVGLNTVYPAIKGTLQSLGVEVSDDSNAGSNVDLFRKLFIVTTKQVIVLYFVDYGGILRL